MAERNGEAQKRWRRKPENQEKERVRTQKRWREDPRVPARRLAQQAKRRGKTVVGPCVFCGKKENIHQHHFDYKRPLEVVFICSDCHVKYHELRRKEIKRKELKKQEKGNNG
jgi:hypothetical protein